MPKEYQQVEYIESTGTQYIITNIYPSTEYIITIKAQYTKNQNGKICGIMNTHTWNASYACMELVSKKIYVHDGTRGIKNISNWQDIFIYTFDYKNMKFYLNNEDENIELIPNNYPKIPLGLFGANMVSTGINGRTSCKIYYVTVLGENNKVVFSLFPCYRKLDGKLGMYDIVNDVFYTNANTNGTDFIKGPEV